MNKLLCRNALYNQSESASGAALGGGPTDASDGDDDVPTGTGGANAAFRHLGWAGLAEDAASFAFGSDNDAEREDFLNKDKRGMSASFLRGHTVCGASVTVADVVNMVLCKWGPDGGPFEPVSSLPLGLRDLVGRWVLSHRNGK